MEDVSRKHAEGGTVASPSMVVKQVPSYSSGEAQEPARAPEQKSLVSFLYNICAFKRESIYCS